MYTLADMKVRSRCEAPPPAEIEPTPTKPSDSQPSGPAPSGPEVFHMASDDSQDEAGGEVSDNDFFPDFPGVAARAETPIESEVEKDEETIHEDVGTDSKAHVKEAHECGDVERASLPTKLPVEANHVDPTESSTVKSCVPPANPADDRDDMAATDKAGNTIHKAASFKQSWTKLHNSHVLYYGWEESPTYSLHHDLVSGW